MALIHLSIIGTVFVWIPSAGAVAPVEAEVLAKRVVELLAKGDEHAVIDYMHYPRSYNKHQLEADREGVEVSLTFLLRKFGVPEMDKGTVEGVSFFEIGAGRGDMAYWASASMPKAVDIIHSVRFSKIGPGVLKVRVFWDVTSGAYGVQSVGFGLFADHGDSKATIASITKDMMRVKGVAIPADIDKMLQDSLRPEKAQF